jgi:hypothetical protein
MLCAVRSQLYHPDAEELYSLTQDLQQVVTTLTDPRVGLRRKVCMLVCVWAECAALNIAERCVCWRWWGHRPSDGIY